MGKTYFISDLHFRHSNIMEYDQRPFRDIDSHDAEIIRRWNERVTDEDDVWILGDIGIGSSNKIAAILSKLNGTKRLCVGNHDKKLLKNHDIRAQFAEITDYKEIRMKDGNTLVLCHYPIPCYNGQYHGGYHFYGHVHKSHDWNVMLDTKCALKNNMYNVGCMIYYMDYTPRTFEEITKTDTKYEEYLRD